MEDNSGLCVFEVIKCRYEHWGQSKLHTGGRKEPFWKDG